MVLLVKPSINLIHFGQQMMLMCYVFAKKTVSHLINTLPFLFVPFSNKRNIGILMDVSGFLKI